MQGKCSRKINAAAAGCDGSRSMAKEDSSHMEQEKGVPLQAERPGQVAVKGSVFSCGRGLPVVLLAAAGFKAKPAVGRAVTGNGGHHQHHGDQTQDHGDRASDRPGYDGVGEHRGYGRSYYSVRFSHIVLHKIPPKAV